MKHSFLLFFAVFAASAATFVSPSGAGGGGGGGEINTFSSLAESNATVKQITAQKVGADLQFFGAQAGTNMHLTMTPTTIVFNATSAGGGGSGSGETNFLGNAGLTNATRISLLGGKVNNTNLVKTVTAGGVGIELDDQVTNIVAQLVISAVGDLVFITNGNLLIISNTASGGAVTNLTFDAQFFFDGSHVAIASGLNATNAQFHQQTANATALRIIPFVGGVGEPFEIRATNGPNIFWVDSNSVVRASNFVMTAQTIWSDADASHSFVLRASPTTTVNQTNSWPTTNALPGQVLTSDGSQWYWASGTSGEVTNLVFDTFQFTVDGDNVRLLQGVRLTNAEAYQASANATALRVTSRTGGVGEPFEVLGTNASKALWVTSNGVTHVSDLSAPGAANVSTLTATNAAQFQQSISVRTSVNATSLILTNNATVSGNVTAPTLFIYGSANVSTLTATNAAQFRAGINAAGTVNASSLNITNGIALRDADNSATFTWQAPAVIPSSITLSPPTTNGLAGQVWHADGSSGSYWATIEGGGGGGTTYLFDPLHFSVVGTNVVLASGVRLTNFSAYQASANATALRAISYVGGVGEPFEVLWTNAAAVLFVNSNGVTHASNIVVLNQLLFNDADASHRFVMKAAATTTVNQTNSWPATNALAGQVLTSDGSQWYWSDGGGGVMLTNSTEMNGTQFALDGNIYTFKNGAPITNVNVYSALNLWEDDGANVVQITLSDDASNWTWVLPPTNGLAGQFLFTDGTASYWKTQTGVTNVVNASLSFSAARFGWVGLTNNGDVRIKTVSSANASIMIQEEGTNLNLSLPIGVTMTNALFWTRPDQFDQDNIRIALRPGHVGDAIAVVNTNTTEEIFLIRSNAVVWNPRGIETKEVVWFTNTTTFGSPVTVIDMATNSLQTVTLTGNTGIITTNRTARNGVLAKTVRFIASGGDRVVTNNASHRIYGTNSWFTVPSGKSARLSLWMYSTAESGIEADYQIQSN